MERLSGMRVSEEWARALVACVDEVPVGSGQRRRGWALGVALVVVGVVGVAGFVVWACLFGGWHRLIH
jgi:hypothetical protein